MPSFDTLIAIVGLPRSGTTLSAAIFDAHPAITTCFEPWNSNRKQRVTGDITLKELVKKYSIKPAWRSNIFAVKETTIDDEAINWLAEFLAQQATERQIKLVWTVRQYRHTYLSLIDGARKYWGHTDLDVNVESYNQWVNRANVATGKLANLYEKYDGTIYSYDAMVANPSGLLPELMTSIGVRYDKQQLDYFRHVEKKGIRGDVGLSKKPAPISTDSLHKRDQEWEQVYQQLQTAEADPLRQQLDDFAAKVYELGVTRNDIRSWLPG